MVKIHNTQPAISDPIAPMAGVLISLLYYNHIRQTGPALPQRQYYDYPAYFPGINWRDPHTSISDLNPDTIASVHQYLLKLSRLI